MKRIFIVNGIGIVVLLALLVWGVVVGIGYFWNNAPSWLEGGERIAVEAVSRAQETLPAVTDQVEAVVPGLASQIDGLIPGLRSKIDGLIPGLIPGLVPALVPGAALPTQDVGGQDLADIPRFPGMVRVAYSLAGQKRTVAYQAQAEFGQVVAFYTSEMAQRRFAGQVTSASPAEEVHLYRRGKEQFEFRFTKVSQLGAATTALEIREP